MKYSPFPEVTTVRALAFVMACAMTFLMTCAIGGRPVYAAQGEGEADAALELYFVLQHAPGPKWDPGLPYLVQPGIEEHVQYITGHHDEATIVMGGPYLDGSGGMVIISAATPDEAKAIAMADPAVQAGLLTVQVRHWQAVISSSRPVRSRAPGRPVSKDQPFKVKSLNPGAPINIERE